MYRLIEISTNETPCKQDQADLVDHRQSMKALSLSIRNMWESVEYIYHSRYIFVLEIVRHSFVTAMEA